MHLPKTFNRTVLILSIIAGLLYSSWPLGYWLNPKVAQHSLASGLEAVGQPFNWLFITTDITSSAVLIVIVLLLWRAYRKSQPRRLLQISLSCIALFAIGTSIDALLPEHCVPNLMQCPNFTQDHYLLLHGIFSITASVFLFVGLAVVWFQQRKDALLNVLLIGYVLFGLISLGEAILPGQHGNWAENYYITLCSLWIVYIPRAVSLLTWRSSCAALKPMSSRV